METTYEISLKMKVQKRVEEYARFFVGNNREFAYQLFHSMEGSENVSPTSIIMIDLVKWEKGVPCPIVLKHCTYEQIAFNAKLITKELFKHFNLE